MMLMMMIMMIMMIVLNHEHEIDSESQVVPIYPPLSSAKLEL